MIFIYLCLNIYLAALGLLAVGSLLAACRALWLQHVVSSFLTREPGAPCMGVWSLDHWTRKKSLHHILKAVFCPQGTCRRSGYVSLRSYLSAPFVVLLFFYLSATQWSIDSMTVCLNETPFPSPSSVPVLSPDTHILVMNASCSPAIGHV